MAYMQFPRVAEEEDPEMVKVLEALVTDNSDLQRGHAEMQALLQEAREDARALQEEVEELRAAVPRPVNRACF
jgi:hypothetical protein